MARKVAFQQLFCIGGDVVDGAPQETHEGRGHVRTGKFHQRLAFPDGTRLLGSVYVLLLFDNLSSDIGSFWQRDKALQLHTSWYVRVDSFGSPSDLGRLRAAVLSQPRVFLRQPDALLADNDAVEVSLLLNVDNIAGVDVFSDKHPVKDRDRGLGCCPGRAVETNRTGIEKKLHT